jgi:hypothetical protein
MCEQGALEALSPQGKVFPMSFPFQTLESSVYGIWQVPEMASKNLSYCPSAKCLISFLFSFFAALGLELKAYTLSYDTWLFFLAVLSFEFWGPHLLGRHLSHSTSRLISF